MRLYAYVGNQDLNMSSYSTHRQRVLSSSDALSFLKCEADLNRQFHLTTTFVVDVAGILWIADRHSEHIACARGGIVLAAGEMTFIGCKNQIMETEVSNLSTGY